MYYLKSFRFISIGVTLLFLFSQTACKKNVAGPQGDPGTPGKPGNLKQSHINSLKVLSSSWTETPDYNWETSLYIGEINKQVIEKGEVELYFEADSQWNPLPYGKGYLFMQYSISENSLHLEYKSIHGGAVPKPPDGNYRIVIFSPA